MGIIRFYKSKETSKRVSNITVSGEEFEHKNKLMTILQQAIKETNNDKETFKKLFEEEQEIELKCDFSTKINCPKDILEELMNDDSTRVRIAVAYNKNCPQKVLNYLADDECNEVRAAVAKNNNCSKETIITLTNDCCEKVRYSALSYGKLPIELFEKITATKNNWIEKVCIASNPNCPEHILEELLKHEENDITRTIAKRENCTEEIINIIFDVYKKNSLNQKIGESIAKQKNCSTEILAKLSDEEDADIRKAVADNRNCPKDTLIKTLRNLSKEDDSKLFVITKPECPKEILQELTKDPDPIIRRAAKQKITEGTQKTATPHL